MQELSDVNLVQVSGGGKTKVYGVQALALEFCEIVFKGNTKAQQQTPGNKND